MHTKRFEIPFFITLVVVATGLLLFILFPYLTSIIAAIALFILFHPVYANIKKVFPQHEGVASFLAVLAAIIIILLPVSFFGFKIFQEAQDLYIRLSAGNTGIFSDFINDKLAAVMPKLHLDFNQYIKQGLGLLVSGIGPIFTRVSATVIKIFLSLFVLYYFFKDSGRIKKSFLQRSPLSAANTEKIADKLLGMASAVIKGTLVVAVVQGFLVGLGFFLFGLSNPVLWGSFSVLAALIPLLGVSLVVVPGIISLFLSGNILMAIGFAVWAILVVGLADNFLRPKLIEKDLKIHPLLIFLSVLGGLAVFGPAGLLLGPLVLSLFLALLEISPMILEEKK